MKTKGTLVANSNTHTS